MALGWRRTAVVGGRNPGNGWRMREGVQTMGRRGFARALRLLLLPDHQRGWCSSSSSKKTEEGFVWAGDERKKSFVVDPWVVSVSMSGMYYSVD